MTLVVTEPKYIPVAKRSFRENCRTLALVSAQATDLVNLLCYGNGAVTHPYKTVLRIKYVS